MQVLARTERTEHPEGVPVFNFRVAEYHTYYVQGATGLTPPVLVHNADHGYRVMTREEYREASKGIWRDSSVNHNDPNERGSKWLWSNEAAARRWQEFLKQGGENNETVITRVPLSVDSKDLPRFPHTDPHGTAIHAPINVLGNAREIP